MSDFLEPPQSPEELRAREAIRRVGLFAGGPLRLERAAAPVMVPMHRAVENECWFLSGAAGEECFLKVLCDDMRPFVDLAATLDASGKAADLGLAPAVKGHSIELGAVAFERLSDQWRTADMEALQDRDTRASLIAAKRTLHRGPAFERKRTIFDLLADYRRMQERIDAPYPESDRDLQENIARIESGFLAAGFDLRSCHGDGIASNVMLSPGGEVRLVDFEWAARNDPHYDLGALLVDIEQWDDGIRAAVEIYAGHCEERVFNRVKLHMILDDFMWASFAIMAAYQSNRRNVEFFKYGAFKLLRCRYHLRVWPVEEMLRRI